MWISKKNATRLIEENKVLKTKLEEYQGKKKKATYEIISGNKIVTIVEADTVNINPETFQTTLYNDGIFVFACKLDNIKKIK